jgi:hypothetical protein
MNFLEAIDGYEKLKQECLRVDVTQDSFGSYEDRRRKVYHCNQMLTQLSQQGSRRGFLAELPDFHLPSAVTLGKGTGTLPADDEVKEDRASKITENQQKVYKQEFIKQGHSWMLHVLELPQNLKKVAEITVSHPEEALEYLNYYILKEMIDRTKMAGFKEQYSAERICAAVMKDIAACEYSLHSQCSGQIFALEARETLAMANALRLHLKCKYKTILQYDADHPLTASEDIRNGQQICKTLQAQVYCRVLTGYAAKLLQYSEHRLPMDQRQKRELADIKSHFHATEKLLQAESVKYIPAPNLSKEFEDILTAYYIKGGGNTFLSKLQHFALGEIQYGLGIKKNIAVEKNKQPFHTR